MHAAGTMHSRGTGTSSSGGVACLWFPSTMKKIARYVDDMSTAHGVEAR